MTIATIDTNVVLAGMRSRRGASYQVLRAWEHSRFEPALSLALLLEYEAVATRPEQLDAIAQSADAVLDVLRRLAFLARAVPSIGYRWRPMLADPDDDMVLECATASRSDYLVTLNVRDFNVPDHAFGFEVVRPAVFLDRL